MLDNFFQQVLGWHPHIPSVILTALLCPLVLYLSNLVLKHLKMWAGYVLEGVLYWLTRSVKHSFAGALTLRHYCRLQLSGSSRYLHVPSLLDVKLPIDRVYVTLTLESQGGEKTSYSHSDILTAGNRIRVVGDPGSGKSSLIKRLFRDACENGIRAPRRSRLPVLLELKNLNIPEGMLEDELGRWLYDKLRASTMEGAAYRMGECYDGYAETSGILVLLDGLDEVSTTDYQRVQIAILQLSRRLGQIGDHNSIILTMRTQFHQQIKDDFRDDFGSALFLNPFNPSDIYKFLSRWPFSESVDRHVTRIYKELTDRPTLREMCSNPLVLSMYVADDQSSSHTVAPDSRTGFYTKVTEELIIRRRLKQTGQAPAATTLREQRFRILGSLAYEHILDPNQPANSLLWPEAIRIVRQVLKCTDAEAELTFRELAKETGLISEERPGQSLRFIHLTFCEFLAANESVQGRADGWEILVETHRSFQQGRQPQLRARLSEVIPFACGLLPSYRRDDALSDVNGLGDSRLTALSFLETKLYDHPSWPSFVRSEKAGLLETPESHWDEQWLRRLHLYSVIVRDARHSSRYLPVAGGTEDLAEFFKRLIEKQKDSMYPVLSAYADQDAAAAFRLAEVCNLSLAQDFPQIVITKCDQLPFFSMVKEQILSEPQQVELWATLLSEAALRSPVVAMWLLETKTASALDRFTRRKPSSIAWHNSSSLKGTMYGQLLTITVTAEIKENWPALTYLLKRIPAQSTRAFQFSITVAVILSSMLVPLLWILRPHADFIFQQEWFSLSPSLFLTPLLFFMVIYMQAILNRRRVLYDILLNIYPTNVPVILDPPKQSLIGIARWTSVPFMPRIRKAVIAFLKIRQKGSMILTQDVLDSIS